MKCLSLALTLGLAATAAAQTPDAEAESGLSTNLALTSEYTWRGISFSDRKPSLQASLDYTRPLAGSLALEGGLWLYSSKYPERPGISYDAGFYAGINGALSEDWRWALRSQHIRYPQASDWHYAEHSLHLLRAAGEAVGDSGWELAYALSPRAFGSASRGRYLEAEWSLVLPQQLVLRLHAGRSLFSQPELSYRNFNDYKLSLSGQWQGLDIEAGWIATSNASQFGRMGKARAVLTLGHAF